MFSELMFHSLREILRHAVVASTLPLLTLTDSHLKVVDFFHLHCLSVAQPFH